MNEPFVKTWIYRDSVESTNDLAKEIVAGNPPPLPLLVWTRRQTRGRGRGQNVWWSDGGSLTFTIGVNPRDHSLGPQHEPRIALAMAVAAIDVLSQFSLREPLVIRWPNDIEAAGRKLGGILPERIETEDGPRIVIGLGLNILSELKDSPEAIKRMAVSLAELAEAQLPSFEDLLALIVAGLAPTLESLARDDCSLAERWRDRDGLRGHPVQVDLGGRIISGVGQGIDEEGALLVASEGEVHQIFGGQVLRTPR